MNKLGNFLKERRGNRSLREFAEICQISHTHLDSLEKGIDPRTKKPVSITTETLKKIADNLGVDYLVLAALAENEEAIFCSPEENKRIGQQLSKLDYEKAFWGAGIKNETIEDMVHGQYLFSLNTLSQVARMTGKDITYFLSAEAQHKNTDNKKSPALTEKDERDIAKAVERIMGDLENSGNLMFDGVPMSPEAKESMAAAMKLGLEAARLKNKDTYSLKRFRKE